MRRYICKPSPSKPSKKKKPSIFSRKVHLEKERSTSNITGGGKRISVHSRSSQKIAITEASHSAPLPPQLVRPFIVPSLFAWPLIRPLCSIKASVQGTSSGPESAFNNGSPFSWDNRRERFLRRNLPLWSGSRDEGGSPTARRRRGNSPQRELAIADRCTINWLCTVISGKSLLPPGQDPGILLFSAADIVNRSTGQRAISTRRKSNVLLYPFRESFLIFLFFSSFFFSVFEGIYTRGIRNSPFNRWWRGLKGSKEDDGWVITGGEIDQNIVIRRYLSKDILHLLRSKYFVVFRSWNWIPFSFLRDFPKEKCCKKKNFKHAWIIIVLLW